MTASAQHKKRLVWSSLGYTGFRAYYPELFRLQPVLIRFWRPVSCNIRMCKPVDSVSLSVIVRQTDSQILNREDPKMKYHVPFLRVLFLAIALILGLSAAASAQEITGSITGSVHDTNGAAVSGATVTITDTEKKVVVRTLTTNEDGAYAAPSLPVGIYDVLVEASGFKKYLGSKVKIDVGQRRTLDIALEA